MTGLCVSCTTWFTTRPRTGLIRNHADRRGNLCPGSGTLPKTEETNA